jgi:hypothetical protein
MIRRAAALAPLRGQAREPLGWAAGAVRWDGHVLVSSPTFEGLSTRRARMLWPGWRPRP